MHASACAWSVSSSPDAGARVTRRMPSRCTFSTSGQHAHLAVDCAAHARGSTARGRTPRTPSRIDGHAAEPRPTPASTSAGARAARPGPCRRSRRGASSARRGARSRRPRRARPARSIDRGERRGVDAERAERRPSRRARSCATSSVRGPGRTGTQTLQRDCCARPGPLPTRNVDDARVLRGAFGRASRRRARRRRARRPRPRARPRRDRGT